MRQPERWLRFRGDAPNRGTLASRQELLLCKWQVSEPLSPSGHHPWGLRGIFLLNRFFFQLML